MPKPRPSAYRRSYGPGGKDDYVTVDANVKHMKEAEKDKMKKLNNRLVSYIDKVHDLETTNRKLAAENAKLRRLNNTPETDVAAIYDDELQRLREKVEQLQTENAGLEIARDNLAYDLEEVSGKYEVEKEEKEDLEKEVKSLRKDVDDATIERVNLESKIENQQEAMELQKQVHEAEMENLRRQVQPVEAPILNAEQPSILPDLEKSIVSVRKEYEQFNAKSIQDLDDYYKEKVDNLNKQLKAAQEEIRDLRVDNAEKRKKINQLEMEIEALRSKNDSLDNNVDRLEDRLAREAKENDELLHKLHRELDTTKEDLGKYLKDYQNLNSLKLSLEQEIQIYHKLLSGEETRISEIDTKVVVVKAPSNRSSRSSSRSSSSSSSRNSSHERKTEDIVEEMLEKSEAVPEKKEPSTGVISVSWKVKGGTVRPVNPFKPEGDVEALRKAMKGFGTDEGAIIEILSKRTKIQRLVIARAYEEKYDDNLLDDLEKELSGNIKAVCQHLMWRKSELDAHAIRKAIKGFGTDEAVLIEILCTQSGREIDDIKKDYAQIFDGRDLQKDIESETSGQFKAFLSAILKGNRPIDSGTVVSSLAEDDAKRLFEIHVKNWSPSNPIFLEIFTQRSYQHLWYVFKQCWPKLSKADLMEQIEKECKGDVKMGLKTLIRFSTYIPPHYYAIQIHEAMAGRGTSDKQLIYMITTRSEIDLIDIKEEYQRMFMASLVKTIEDETSGDYKKMLIAILN